MSENEKIRGSDIKATLSHDAGAYGRCSECGCYSDNPKILKHNHPCGTCGKKTSWGGSFRKPESNDQWSD